MVCLFSNITRQVAVCLFTRGRRSSLHEVDNQYTCQITTWAAFFVQKCAPPCTARVWLGKRRKYVRRACTSSLCARSPPTWVCVRDTNRIRECFLFWGGGGVGGWFRELFVGICVDDISNKILHAMCVKWRPIHIIHRGSGNA